ncbi:MAG: RNA 2',3'-cyclic phosphodiesterase [Candidatus Parvarchaeum sp.]
MNRYFIAIELPEKVRKGLISFFYPSLAQNIEGKFVAEEKLHITLLFLGNIEITPEELDFIEGFKIFKGLKIRGIGAFPSLENPRTVYAKVYGDLQPEFEKLCSFFKIKASERFTPHVTICRVKKLINSIKENDFESTGFEFTADSLHLFNSDFVSYYKIV